MMGKYWVTGLSNDTMYMPDDTVILVISDIVQPYHEKFSDCS